MVRSHQPDEAVFRSVLPDIEWKPVPAFPPSVRLAIVVGNPSEPGPYLIRVKVPFGVKIMPHSHPEDRIYTVMSGVFYIGLGDQFDGDKVKASPPGSVIVLPGDTSHFHWANPASTSPRYLPLARWDSTTWIPVTTPASKVATTRARRNPIASDREVIPPYFRIC
jgi:quercetin dioxygenase-like cupin family protein